MTTRSIRVEDLPAPPVGRTGFPWTEGTPALHNDDGSAYPKITIVTPSYKQGQYLEETIRSVLLQGYPNLEYIVIDGGSPDNSAEIIDKYAPFLAYWVSERDSGQANAINKGFAHATGEIMGWLNSDDLLLPNALQHIARTFMEKPNVRFVTGLRKIIDECSQITGNWIRDIPTDYYLHHYCCIAQETTYWRRSSWEELGALDENLQFAMDYEYWVRALDHSYSFHLIPRYIGAFRDYAQNKTNSWHDVYYRDMGVIYHRYNIGRDEADVHAKLGWRWAQRYRMYVKLSQQSWTNSPRLVQLAWHILEIPVFCYLALSVYRLWKSYDELRPYQSSAKAFTSALTSTARSIASSLRYRAPASEGDWGSIRDLPEFTDLEGQSNVPADTLSFGSGWHPVEFYRGEYFRWSSGMGELYLHNPNQQLNQLRLVVAPALLSPDNRLEVVDENGKLLVRAVINAPRVEINLQPPPTSGAKYELRWRGSTLQGQQNDRRSLAFRLIRAGWRDTASHLMLAYAAFQQAVEHALTRHALEHLPLLGTLITALHHWGNAGRVMSSQLALWQELVHHQALLEQKIHKTTSPPRLVIDCSTLMLNNNGDIAMFTVLLRRVRARYPDAHISMITNDPAGIAAIDPLVEPIVVGMRQQWSLETYLPEPLPDHKRIDLYMLQNAIRRVAPMRYWGLIGDSAAAQSGREWQAQISHADAVILTGGGYFTDAFAEHTAFLLTTLEEGIVHGKAAFIVGCGFEPISDPLLKAVADRVLPRVDLIACRENTYSPQVLARHGVSHFVVTGDDALELAYDARPAELGDSIGVNLRNALYNPVDDEQIAVVRRVLHPAATTFGAPLLPIPISNYDPSDMNEIEKLLPDDAPPNISLNTPEKLFDQLRRCRVVVTGSYHAAVFGLAMGIPVIALTRSSHYEHKMSGLMAMFHQDDDYILSLDDPELETKLSVALERAWSTAELRHPRLLEAAEEQIRAGLDAYDAIFERIDAARGRAAQPEPRLP